MLRKYDALKYIKKKTSTIIDINKFELVDISQSNAGDSWLAHFAALGKTKEVEFAAELCGVDNSISYYSYKEDLTRIDDLNTYINAALKLPDP